METYTTNRLILFANYLLVAFFVMLVVSGIVIKSKLIMIILSVVFLIIYILAIIRAINAKITITENEIILKKGILNTETVNVKWVDIDTIESKGVSEDMRWELKKNNKTIATISDNYKNVKSLIKTIQIRINNTNA